MIDDDSVYVLSKIHSAAPDPFLKPPVTDRDICQILADWNPQMTMVRQDLTNFVAQKFSVRRIALVLSELKRDNFVEEKFFCVPSKKKVGGVLYVVAKVKDPSWTQHDIYSRSGFVSPLLSAHHDRLTMALKLSWW